MTTQLSTIQFYNRTLTTFEQNNVYYVAMKPICENIGLAWNAQLLRIKRDEVLSQGMIVMITPTNGGEQEMVCLPIQYLNGWLFGIDVKRVKPEIRETLITYKRECYQALFDYWNKGKAERTQTTVDDRTGLRDAVNMLVSKKGLLYSDAYQLIHQRFNVNHIDELAKEQLPQAVEYIHKIVLEGELIEPKKHQTVNIPFNVADALMKFHYLAINNAKKTERALRIIHETMGYERYVRNDLAAGNFDIHNEFIHWVDEFEKAVIEAKEI
ncbi:Phage anti-repressor protein [Gallibacterium anatis]|uniref:Phage anti-repressor protein n=1 Tax=Gallibacterium anatis TaxID=750 RepID=A0A377H5I4_9PAST|nr:phage antirepressor N-terminal domain-containing protein [Gallibacterium anatis]KGQ55339.1 antirepressor [Gallibacterium anatis DSM 16844 = F 149]STO37618.1 Phage anti-repressor protein [Gallibacterium anatis]STO61161.1 Phage anti-repressor protein [Gallibacterium anatis]